jgi:hypothetical protein
MKTNTKRIAARSGGSSLNVSSFVRTARLAAFAGLSALGAVAYTNASAQVITPPPATHEITVFPMRDFVGMAGFIGDTDLLVQVRRGNSVVGVARGRNSPEGEMELNHPGDFAYCWQDVTPDLTAYDVVQVTYDNTQHNLDKGGVPIGSGYATRTAGISAQRAYIDGNNNVIVKGKALQGITAIPLARLEVRIRDKEFMSPLEGSRLGKQDIRAVATPAPLRGDNGPITGTLATLAYDPPTAACRVGCFTAVFSGLNEYERETATRGQTRVMSWQATDAAATRLGMTIYEEDEISGPGGGACPAGPGGAIGPNPPDYPVPYNPLNLIDAANPPADPSAMMEVAVFPMRDFTGAEGLAPKSKQDIQFVLRRQDPNNPNNTNGVIVGTARGVTTDILVDDETAERMDVLEVNHPGGVCWSGQTPDMRAGDKLDVFKIVGGTLVNGKMVGGTFAGGQTQEVIDVSISEPPFINGSNQLIVRGTMPAGFVMSRMEQRIVQPLFRDTQGSRIGKRDIRADVFGGVIRDVNGATGWLVPTSATTWEATYTGLNATELGLAMKGGFRIMAWQSDGPVPVGGGEGLRIGLTIWEYGEHGGPGMGGCPAAGGFTVPVPMP